MKIAQIAPPWIAIPPQNYGGTEIVIYHLIEELVTQGHDITLFTTGDSKTSAHQVSFLPHTLTAEGVPWAAHPKAYYHLHEAIERIKEEAFDIVHSHLSATTDMYVFPLTADLATPHVTTLHNNFPFDIMPGRWVGDADKYYIQEWGANIPLVAISESARAQQPFKLNFAGVVHNGIAMQNYRLRSKQRKDYFVWLGRFVPEKGAHLAIEAARKAQVPLILAGVRDRRDKEAMAYFHEQVEPYIDNDRIRFQGPVSMKQKIALLSKAKALLNPIEWEEPFGIVMLEAMALGCPVISFARGAAPEIVVHGKTGFLVQNVDEMVEYMPRIDEIDRAATRQHVEDNFSAHAMAKNYVRIYQQIIDGTNKPLLTAFSR